MSYEWKPKNSHKTMWDLWDSGWGHEELLGYVIFYEPYSSWGVHRKVQGGYICEVPFTKGLTLPEAKQFLETICRISK